MIRRKKKFSWPKKLWDKPRILEENKLVDKYGLKNKREIWKTDAKVDYLRNRAKSLITKNIEEQQIFFDKLNKIGLNVNSISDVLALNKEDLLKRRLSSVLVSKKLAITPKQARQLIVHKKIMVGDSVVNVPSYLVPVKEENLISIKKKSKKLKVKEVSISEKTSSEEKVQEIVGVKEDENTK